MGGQQEWKQKTRGGCWSKDEQTWCPHQGSSRMNDILKEEPTGFAASALDVNVRRRNESAVTPKSLTSESIVTEDGGNQQDKD